MRFIEALNLINLCVKHKVLAEMDGGIVVYRNGTETSPKGWYLERKEDLAQELMHVILLCCCSRKDCGSPLSFQ